MVYTLRVLLSESLKQGDREHTQNKESKQDIATIFVRKSEEKDNLR